MLRNTHGSNAFYYWELPWQERALFVYRSIPINLGLQSILRLNGVEAWNPQISATTQGSLVRFEQEIRRGARGSQMTDVPQPLDHLTSGLACDHYLFGLFEFPDISKTFRDNLQRLSTLRQTSGARVFFTWPAVAARDNDECYQLLGPGIQQYTDNIRQISEEQGFAFLGEPGHSRFDSSCMLDTYYHVRARCANARTQRLILQLEEAGLRPAAWDPKALQEQLLAHLNQHAPTAAKRSRSDPLVSAEKESPNPAAPQ